MVPAHDSGALTDKRVKHTDTFTTTYSGKPGPAELVPKLVPSSVIYDLMQEEKRRD